MAVTVAQLRTALRIGATDQETAELTRLLTYATRAVADYAPDAPTAVEDEAVVRLVGFLYDAPTVPGRPASAIRQSGAAAILAPYRTRRAGSTSGAESAAAGTPATPGTPGTTGGVDQTARDAAAAAQATADANTAALAGKQNQLMPPTPQEAAAGAATTIRGWTAALLRTLVEAIVPSWARGNDPSGRYLPEFPAAGSRDKKVPRFDADALKWQTDTGADALAKAEQALARPALPDFPAAGSRDNKAPIFDDDILVWQIDPAVAVDAKANRNAQDIAALKPRVDTAASDAATAKADSASALAAASNSPSKAELEQYVGGTFRRWAGGTVNALTNRTVSVDLSSDVADFDDILDGRPIHLTASAHVNVGTGHLDILAGNTRLARVPFDADDDEVNLFLPVELPRNDEGGYDSRTVSARLTATTECSVAGFRFDVYAPRSRVLGAGSVAREDLTADLLGQLQTRWTEGATLALTDTTNVLSNERTKLQLTSAEPTTHNWVLVEYTGWTMLNRTTARGLAIYSVKGLIDDSVVTLGQTVGMARFGASGFTGTRGDTASPMQLLVQQDATSKAVSIVADPRNAATGPFWFLPAGASIRLTTISTAGDANARQLLDLIATEHVAAQVEAGGGTRAPSLVGTWNFTTASSPSGNLRSKGFRDTNLDIPDGAELLYFSAGQSTVTLLDGRKFIYRPSDFGIVRVADIPTVANGQLKDTTTGNPAVRTEHGLILDELVRDNADVLVGRVGNSIYMLIDDANAMHAGSVSVYA